jgi:UPF0716 protein FxsA
VSQAGPEPGAARPRPRGLRRYLPLTVAAWVVLEIWLLIELAGLIGGLGVLGYLLASALLGGWVVKRAGLKAFRATAAGMRGGGYPAGGGDPVTSETRTAVTIAGGLLLVLPGILSDLLGLACLFPPTAALLRRVPERWLRRAGTPLGDAFRLQEQLRIHRPDGKVVQGEVVDPVEDPLRKRDDPYGYGGSRDQLH